MVPVSQELRSSSPAWLEFKVSQDVAIKCQLGLEAPLPRGSTYKAGKLVLVIGRRPWFFSTWVSLQSDLSVLRVVVGFLRDGDVEVKAETAKPFVT